MPNGNAAQMPSRPNGSQEPAPAAEASTGMSSSDAKEKSGSAASANTIRAATAMPVTTKLNRSASPTPHRWMPRKIAKQTRYIGQPDSRPNRPSDST